MNLIINGELRQLDCHKVTDLVAQLSPNSQALALAINGTVVPKTQWSHRTVSDGDKIDLFSVIAGG